MASLFQTLASLHFLTNLEKITWKVAGWCFIVHPKFHIFILLHKINNQETTFLLLLYNKCILFQLKQDSLSKSLIVKEQNEEIVKLKSKIEEQKISLEEFAQNLKTVQEKKEDQDKLIKNLESRNQGEYNMK